MGLLDDAIRDHLDLKRRRGADPAEVERAEREALGPVRRGPEAQSAVEGEHDVLESDARFEPSDDEAWDQLEAEHAAGAMPEFEHAEHENAGLSHPELEHLDLEHPPFEHAGFDLVEPELGTGHDLAEHQPVDLSEPPQPPGPVHLDSPAPGPLHIDPPPAAPGTGSPDDEPPTAEFFEPAETQEKAQPDARPIVPETGGETVEYDVERALTSDEHASGEHDEDVLEETPEFLQDTPDHDRLWFEQRPPRDFDFDG